MYQDQLEISVTTENKNDGLYIHVSDNGVGISKSEEEKIFGKLSLIYPRCRIYYYIFCIPDKFPPSVSIVFSKLVKMELLRLSRLIFLSVSRTLRLVEKRQ